MESKRLSQRLARLFRASVLLRSPPCNFSASTSSSSIFSSTAAGSTSSRCSISTSIALEPVFLPRNVHTTVDIIPPLLRGNDVVDRSLSVPGPPTRTSPERNLDKNGARSSSTPMATSTPKKNVVRSKKLLSNGYGFSSSSSSDEAFGLFSSDETENFFSSWSFSSDSSEFYNNNSKKKKNKENDNKKKKLSRRPPVHTRTTRSNESESGSSTSGIPVTKRSRDPYADFRDSMVEMIVERQIFGMKGLEELLRSYLSLNSAHHRPAILRAFADISEVLFGQ